MDKDRVKGAAHEAKGAVKEAAGKLTGDTKTQAEGKAEKVGGRFKTRLAEQRMLLAMQ